jgi:hypothetical protein
MFFDKKYRMFFDRKYRMFLASNLMSFPFIDSLYDFVTVVIAND